MNKILKIIAVVILVPIVLVFIVAAFQIGAGGVFLLIVVGVFGLFLYKISYKKPGKKIGAPTSDFKYPELVDFEKQAQKALKGQKNITISLPTSLLDDERWDYLKGKYPKLEAPITSKFNRMHFIYKGKFEKLREKILAGQPLSLNDYEEKNLRPFVELELPGTELLVVKPEVFKTFIAGLKYHDYKKKEVKEMLEMSSLEPLHLEPEPENRYDSFAVKVMWEGFFLGYIPKDHSYTVASAFEDGQKVECHLNEYFKSGPLEERAQIEVRIDRA